MDQCFLTLRPITCQNLCICRKGNATGILWICIVIDGWQYSYRRVNVAAQEKNTLIGVVPGRILRDIQW